METRKCKTCKETKSLEDFYRNRSYPLGRVYHCKPCLLETYKNKYHNDQKYRQRKKEEQALRRELYKNDQDYRERILKQNRDKYNNDDEFRHRILSKKQEQAKANPEEARKKNQRNYQRNKDSYLANNAKRRAKKLSLDEQVDRAFRRFIKLKFNNTCFNCGSTKKLSLDHHKPLSKGHVLVESNCVLLCRSCNSKKRDKNPENFYTKDQLKTLREVYFVGEIN